MTELIQKKCLVTGATGLIGRFVVRRLLDLGHSVRVLVRPTSNLDGLPIDQISVVEGDVTDAASLERAVEGIDWVFHLAVTRHGEKNGTTVHRAGDRPVLYDGALSMANAAANAGVSAFVQGSSAGVVGSRHRGVISETTPLRPDRPYRKLRLAVEQKLTELAAERGLPVTLIRITHAFGPGDKSMLPMFKMIAEGSFKLFGSGRHVHHTSYVEDIANALVAGAKIADLTPPVVLIGSDPMPLRDWLNLIAAETSGSVKYMSWMDPILRPAQWLYDRVGRPFASRLDVVRKIDFHVKPSEYDLSLSRQRLDLPPNVDPAEAIRRTADWYRKSGWM